MKRAVILAAIALGVAAFFYFDAASFLTLANLKAQQTVFETVFAASPIQVIAVFMLLYIALTAVSLPGATILTLAAGALFGLVPGVVIASFSSTIGATLAFLASRYLFRDWVRDRYGPRLGAIDAGMARDGAMYLFSLRLVPVFPFFLVNILMALTAIRVVTFYWVSQIGMIAGTVVYVNAGTQLARIESVRDVVSPGLLASFAVLGLLPWFGRAITNGIGRRRLYAGWKRPCRYDRNLIVIGAGAAGLVSAYIAATVKAKVTLVEAGAMGGDCLNYGCVPSKALIRSAKLAQQIREGDHYGLQAAAPQFSFRAVMARINDIVAAIAPHDSVERYTELGVDVVKGYATIVDPWTVEIREDDGGTRRLTTRAIIIASGGSPFVPPIPGIDEVGYVTSDTLWETFSRLDDAPRRLIVLGGGPIGCELAQSFARLGSAVTQVERGERLLKREDIEVSVLVETALAASGVTVLTGHDAVRCELHGDQKFLVVARAGQESRVPFDALLVAVGRSARLTGFGLETLGIETRGTIVTNDYLQTLFPNIYAAGDVAGPYQFTHVAAHQAWFAAVNALFGSFKMFKADYRVIPWTTFVDPEVARVGLSEAEAQQRGIAYEVTRYPLHELDRAIADSATIGFVKVLTPPGKDRILGVTIVGEHAGELLAEFVLAMKHGLGLSKILGTIHTYPTMAEANKYAAGEWKRAHAPRGLLQIAERYHRWRRG